jgi:hypothetical protein
MSSKKEKEAKEEPTTITTVTTSPSQLQREQQEAVNKALDETKDNIRKTISEARKELPDYAQRVTNLQEQTIDTVKEIADNYIESQREIINSFQSAWTPYIENVVNRTTNFKGIFSPARAAEIYANTLSNCVDNFVIVTRLANNAIFANAELFNTLLQQARDSAKQFSRIGVNAFTTFQQVSSDTAALGYSAAQSVIQRK